MKSTIVNKKTIDVAIEIHKFHTWSSELQGVKPENKGMWCGSKQRTIELCKQTPKAKLLLLPCLSIIIIYHQKVPQLRSKKQKLNEHLN